MRDIYVDSTKGDDANDGLDPDKPRRTIPGMTLEPGDVVHLAEGEYRQPRYVRSNESDDYWRGYRDGRTTPLPPAADAPSSQSP